MKNARRLMAYLLSLAMLPVTAVWQNKAEASADLFLEDFESYATGPITVTNNKAYDYEGNQMSISNVVISGSDYLEIAEENGNKFLKVHTARNSSNSGATRVRFEFGSGYSSGKKEFSYKYKSIAHYSAFRMFGQLFYQVNDNNKTIQALASQTTRIIKGKVNETVFGYVDDLGSANYSSGFGTVTQTVDFDSDTDNYKIVVQHDNATRNTTMTKTISDSIKGIVWSFNNSLGGGNGTETAIDGFAVYAFDDVKVKDLYLELVSTSVANNGIIFGTRPFTLTFDETVSAAPSVTIEEDGNVMSAGDYTVTASGSTVSIVPNSGWTAGASYEITVGTVTSSSGLNWAGATYNLTGDSNLFVEDFEDYEVGTIATGPVNNISTTRNPGGLSYNLLDGDKLEIVEKDGSKVLKLTVGNTISNSQWSGGRLILDFDKYYQNYAYDVGFDYFVENHSKQFDLFGAVFDDKNATTAWIHSNYYSPIIWTNSYIKKLHYNGKSEAAYTIAETAFDKNDAFWKHQSMSIDLSQDPRPATLSVTKVSDGTSLGSKSFSLTRRARYNTPVNSVSALSWVFAGDYYSHKGKDDGDGVYYFDNITIKRPSQKYVGANIADNATDVGLYTNAVLTFEGTVAGTNSITVTENGSTLTEDTDYSVEVDGTDITIASLKDGWKPGATYVISGSVSGSTTGFNNYSGTMLTFTTQAADTSAPKIIWSDIPDGAMHVDPAINEFVLRTDYQELNTVSGANITITKNGNTVSGYTFANYGRYSVKVSNLSLEKGAEYVVTVTGLTNKNGGSVQASAYTCTFNVRNDVYADAVRYVITRDDSGVQNAKVMATIWNKSASSSDYLILGAMNDADENLVRADAGSSGSVASGGVADVEISTTITDDANSFSLFIWENMTTLKALTEKITFNNPTRTYGYDKYISNEPLRIAFLGGSITQQGQYTTPLKTYLNTILNATGRGGITYYDNSKSGVGGTGSDLAIYRAEKDIIDFGPDIVFIDFAVNDGYDSDASEAKRTARKKNMENLIRQFMELPHQPMVIMLDFTTKALGDNRPVIDDAAELRTTYNIANVDVAQYIDDNIRTEENTEGTLVWTTADASPYSSENPTVLTGDSIHPNSAGGNVYATYINSVLSANPTNFFKKMNTLVTPLYASSYRNTRMVSWREGVYSGKWNYTKNGTVYWHLTDGQVTPQSDDATVTFEFTGTTIGLYMATGNVGGLSDSMEYSIDGGEYTTVSSYAGTSAWMANKKILGSNLDPTVVHTITLRAKDVDDKVFCFGYFIVD